MEVPELLTAVKNKVKNCANLPEKYKTVVYFLLRKVWEEVQDKEMQEVIAENKRYKAEDMDVPEFFKDIFRDRSKQ